MNKIAIAGGAVALILGGAIFANNSLNSKAEKELEKTFEQALMMGVTKNGPVECSVLLGNECTIKNVTSDGVKVESLKITGIRDYAALIKDKYGSFSYGITFDGIQAENGENFSNMLLSNPKIAKVLSTEAISALKTNNPTITLSASSDNTKEKSVMDVNYGVGVKDFPLYTSGELKITYKGDVSALEKQMKSNPLAAFSALDKMYFNKLSLQAKHEDSLLMNMIYNAFYLSSIQNQNLTKTQFIEFHKGLFGEKDTIDSKLSLADFTKETKKVLHNKNSVQYKNISSEFKNTGFTEQQIDTIIDELVTESGDLEVAITSKKELPVMRAIQYLSKNPLALMNQVSIKVD